MRYWIQCSILSLLIGGCCGSCIADDLADAKARLELIQHQKKQAEEVAKLAAEKSIETSADSAEELANDTPRPPSADVVLPVADPISTPPVVTFSTVAKSGAVDGLLRSQAAVTQHYLVSEEWCVNCQPVKKRFLEYGRPAENILTINECKWRHKNVPVVKAWMNQLRPGIPFEYSTTEVREVVNPPSYRSQNIMVWGLNKTDFKPARETILAHLREGDQHRGKHWQSWHLESWRTPQLYALHDDDHTGSVPTFEAVRESEVIATVEGGEASPELFAAVLAAHMMESSGQETDDSPIVMGGLFDFTVEVNQSWKSLAQKILTAQKIEFPSAGLTIDFSGANRSFSQIDGDGTTTLKLNPPVKATVQKWIFSWSAALNSVTCADDLSYMQIDMSGCPDVTINLVSRQ